MTTIADIHARWVNARKNSDGTTRDIVAGHRFAHDYYDLLSGRRYEGCTFYDAQIRLDSQDSTQFVGCRFIGSTIYMRDSAAIDLIDNDFQGEFIHESGTNPSNDRKGPTACVRTDGSIANINVLGNRFNGVLRAWTSIANGTGSNINFGFNYYSGLVRSHTDMNRGECVLIHQSEGDPLWEDINFWHDTFDWNPSPHGGDMQVGSTYHGGKKPVLDIHHVNARRINLHRCTFGEHDGIRLTAKEGGFIRNINITDAVGGGYISRGGNVLDIIDRTKLGGGVVPIID